MCECDVCVSDVCVSDVCVSDVCVSDVCVSDVYVSDGFQPSSQTPGCAIMSARASWVSALALHNAFTYTHTHRKIEIETLSLSGNKGRSRTVMTLQEELLSSEPEMFSRDRPTATAKCKCS